MENTTNSQKPFEHNKSHYGKPSVPPNLFTERKVKKMSGFRFWLSVVLFGTISFTVLFYPVPVVVHAEGEAVPVVVYLAAAPFAGTLQADEPVVEVTGGDEQARAVGTRQKGAQRQGGAQGHEEHETAHPPKETVDYCKMHWTT